MKASGCCGKCGEAIAPKAIWLTVNRRCNFRCKWCYGQGTDFDASKEMSLDFAIEITNLALEAGVKKVTIIGGEPTLWEPLLEYNGYCKSAGIHTGIVTNAMRFADDNYWERYKRSPNDIAGISLKAGNPQQLVDTTLVSNFATVEAGISRGTAFFDTGVSITYNTFYVDCLVDMARYAVGCGAKSVKIDFCSTVFDADRPDSKYMVEPTQLVQNIVRDYPALDAATNGKLYFEMSIPFCLWPAGFIDMLKEKGQIASVCHLMKREGAVFNDDGHLIMCNGLFDYPIGEYKHDFSDGADLLELLNSDSITGYYKEITRYPSSVCQKCSWYEQCGGGCPLRWAVYDPQDLIKPGMERR